MFEFMEPLIDVTLPSPQECECPLPPTGTMVPTTPADTTFDCISRDNSETLETCDTSDLLPELQATQAPKPTRTKPAKPLLTQPRTLRKPTEDDDINEVLFIDDHRETKPRKRGGLSAIQYQVNWKFEQPDGHDKDWINESDLDGCQDAIVVYRRWREHQAVCLKISHPAPSLAEYRTMDITWLEIGDSADKSCLQAAIQILADDLHVSNFHLPEDAISDFKIAQGIPQHAGIPPSKMDALFKMAFTHGFNYDARIFSQELLKQSVGDPIRDICRAIFNELDGCFLVVTVTDSSSHCWVLTKCQGLCMIQDKEAIYCLGEMPNVSFIRHIRRVCLQNTRKPRNQRRSESRKRKADMISNSS